MKKFFFFALLFSFTSTKAKVIALGASSSLIHHKGELTPVIKRLVEKTTQQKVTTLEEAVFVTQGKRSQEMSWIRPFGLERWEMEDKFQKLEKELQSDLMVFHFLDPVLPNPKLPQERAFCFVLGSTLSSMKKRLLTLDKLLKTKTLICQEIVLLSGERPLNDEEKLLLKNSSYQYESEVMLSLFYQIFERSHAVTLVSSPMKEYAPHKFTRPTTKDTIELWIKTHRPAVAKSNTTLLALAISSQPFVDYQDTVLRTYLPSFIELETIGELDEARKMNLTIFMDTLGRMLFQELELFTYSKK